MPTNLSLKALRTASPRNEPDFDASLERYEALRAQITASPPSAARRPVRPVRRRRLIRVSATAAAAAVLAGVIVSLSLGGASPQSAYATARRALAATSATHSGTMTLTATGPVPSCGRCTRRGGTASGSRLPAVPCTCSGETGS